MFRLTCFPRSRHLLLLKLNPPSRRAGFLKEYLKIYTPQRLVDKEKHRLVYELKNVSILAGMAKTKYTVPFISVFTVYIAYFYFSVGIMSLYLSASTVLFFCNIFALTKYFHNLVGRVYVNKEGDVKEVVVCAIQKSGRRVDRIHSPKDLVAHDCPFGVVNLGNFVGLSVLNTKIRYKICLSFCTFHDKQVCMDLFGLNSKKKSK